MTMRLGDYYCDVVRRDIAFRVNRVDLRNSMGELVDASTRLISCTGHPVCGRFQRGLPQSVDDLLRDLTGCPLVDTRAILR